METRRFVRMCLLLVVSVLGGGCGTILNGTRATVRVESRPPGATVNIYDRRGTLVTSDQTPCRLRLKRATGIFSAAAYRVRVETPGYVPMEFEVTPAMSGWFWGNIILGGVVGMAVDPLSGGMWKMSPRSKSTQLTRLPGVSPTQVVTETGRPTNPANWPTGTGRTEPTQPRVPVQTPTEPVTPAVGPGTTGQRFAVVIGISQYQDTRVPGLRYASRDAKALYDWLVDSKGGAYAPERVQLLLDKDATGESIRKALFTWTKQAIEEDVVLLYFAGHGSPESPDTPENLFLLPYDVKFDQIATTGFPMWDIETALKRFIKAKKVVVIADACHAGGVGSAFVGERRALEVVPGKVSGGLQSLCKVGDGIAVLTASGAKQLSQESEKWGAGHGVFTHFLLKGLQGGADYNKDGRVTLGELIPYVSEQVRRETGSAQCPEVAGKFDPALPVGR